MSADCAVAIERCGDRCPLRCFVGFTDIGRYADVLVFRISRRRARDP